MISHALSRALCVHVSKQTFEHIMRSCKKTHVSRILMRLGGGGISEGDFMELVTTRFGAISVEENSIITFTQPILGFQEYRRYVLLPGPSKFLHWLQSTDSGKLAFILMNPYSVVPDYKVQASPHDLAELAASKPEDITPFTLVVAPPDPQKIRTNLKAPILINLRQRLAKQVILENSPYPVQFFLAQARQSANDKEVSDARSHA